MKRCITHTLIIFLGVLIPTPSGCSRPPLEEEDQILFEGAWWETGCPLPGCPICFKLYSSGDLTYFSTDSPLDTDHEEWGFEPPNTYLLDVGGMTHRVVVARDGDCFDLQFGLLKEQACACSQPPEEDQ